MNVVIIGGGAAGMAAAITAAQGGHSVTLLERQSRVGRKLLSTGNGRCNLTNRRASPAHYHGDAYFCACALERFGAEDTLAWFAALGLMTVTENSGRVYPMSNMAGSVLDVLRYALERPNITLYTAQTATGIAGGDGRFTVTTQTDAFTADRVILAAGGAAGGKLGGGMDGYRLAGMLGHRRTALYPSLVQLKTDPTWPRALKGVKAECAVAVCRGQTVLAQSSGEVLFTEYGVSGPAIFDVSRAASAGGDGLTCALDLMPRQTEGSLLQWLRQRRQAMAQHPASELLTGSVHNRLGQTVMRAAGFTNTPAAALTEGDLRAVACTLKRFSLPVTGVCSFDQAQITAGGLRTDAFDPHTLESRLVPGFYACGEVLDVDGDCGGYNLQWAWSSGRLAGLLQSSPSAP